MNSHANPLATDDAGFLVSVLVKPGLWWYPALNLAVPGFHVLYCYAGLRLAVPVHYRALGALISGGGTDEVVAPPYYFCYSQLLHCSPWFYELWRCVHCGTDTILDYSP